MICWDPTAVNTRSRTTSDIKQGASAWKIKLFRISSLKHVCFRFSIRLHLLPF